MIVTKKDALEALEVLFGSTNPSVETLLEAERSTGIRLQEFIEDFMFDVIYRQQQQSVYGFVNMHPKGKEIYHTLHVEDIVDLNGGVWPDYVWPGGYAIVYTSPYGENYCGVCAERSQEDDDPSGRVCYWRVQWDEEDVRCCDCQRLIRSASETYGFR